MKIFQLVSAAAAAVMISACGSSVKPVKVSETNGIRPPVAPLMLVDPYFSLWSFSDDLTATPTRHWTGKDQPVIGAVRVDGTVYRVLGKAEPKFDVLLPTQAQDSWSARYMMNKAPKGDWTSAGYDDSSWSYGPGAFGTFDNPGVKTKWSGDGTDIWVRRSFELPEGISLDELVVEYSHDDAFELYINGVEIANTGNSWKNNIVVALSDEAKAAIKPGTVTMAAHCHNTVGGAYVDFGVYRRLPDEVFQNVAVQKSLNVLPTRTVYGFTCGPVDLDLIFTTPLLMDDLDLMSRPVNYVTYEVASNDGAKHSVQVYLEAAPQIAVNASVVPVDVTEGGADGMQYAKAGTVDQPVLKKKGDNVRIDWGYVYVASPAGKGTVSVVDYHDAKACFEAEGKLAESIGTRTIENFVKEKVSLAYAADLGTVGAKKVSDYVLVAYDDIYSIQYFEENLRPYWNRNGDKTITAEMKAAADSYDKVMAKCSAFDSQMMKDARKAGGVKYAELCALAYRQAIAAHKLVEAPNGDLLWLSKENFSNGSIGTVDVTYPSAPLFLLYNVELAKGLLNHIFYYSESGKWTKPFPAHDVGTYPKANGQTYGGDMPVEESGNMIILAGAIAKIEGNADYSAKHWDVLSDWVKYLVEFGQDPANQLCTDDFAGHFAHNANLSVKAIEGIAAYADLAGMLGKNDVKAEYMAKAKEMAAIWKETACDGDHYRLTFDKPGTWSQKYNLVWDKMLGYDVFDADIAKTEMDYYLTVQNQYGLPLDSRKTYTKTDWIVWTATMAEDQATFEKFIDPVYDFMNETDDRVPMSDWIYTDSLRHVGFQARSVVGGYFIKMLEAKLAE